MPKFTSTKLAPVFTRKNENNDRMQDKGKSPEEQATSFNKPVIYKPNFSKPHINSKTMFNVIKENSNLGQVIIMFKSFLFYIQVGGFKFCERAVLKLNVTRENICDKCWPKNKILYQIGVKYPLLDYYFLLLNPFFLYI